MKQKYAKAANSYQIELNVVSSAITKLEGELEVQLKGVNVLITKTEPFKQSLGTIEGIYHECVEANIEDNEYTIYSVEDLSFELNVLKQSLITTKNFIENQIVARTITNVTPQQLESFTETFKHFDKDHTNSLSRDEFKAALQAEGKNVSVFVVNIGCRV